MRYLAVKSIELFKNYSTHPTIFVWNYHIVMSFCCTYSLMWVRTRVRSTLSHRSIFSQLYRWTPQYTSVNSHIIVHNQLGTTKITLSVTIKGYTESKTQLFHTKFAYYIACALAVQMVTRWFLYDITDDIGTFLNKSISLTRLSYERLCSYYAL